MSFSEDDKPAPFVKVPDKVGCRHYHLYAAMEWEGPIYYALCIDAEHDEFEVEFGDDGVSILTHNRNYIILTYDQLTDIATLTEWAAAEYLEWTESEMGQTFEALKKEALSPQQLTDAKKKYGPLIGTRKRV